MIEIYYESSPEVQIISNIIKTRSRDHLTTTLTAWTSRRPSGITAPLSESAWPCQWQTRSLRARAPKDQHPRAAVVAIEPMNRFEAFNTKSRYTTRNPNLTVSKRWQESTPENRRLMFRWSASSSSYIILFGRNKKETLLSSEDSELA